MISYSVTDMMPTFLPSTSLPRYSEPLLFVHLHSCFTASPLIFLLSLRVSFESSFFLSYSLSSSSSLADLFSTAPDRVCARFHFLFLSCCPPPHHHLCYPTPRMEMLMLAWRGLLMAVFATLAAAQTCSIGAGTDGQKDRTTLPETRIDTNGDQAKSKESG